QQRRQGAPPELVEDVGRRQRARNAREQLVIGGGILAFDQRRRREKGQDAWLRRRRIGGCCGKLRCVNHKDSRRCSSQLLISSTTARSACQAHFVVNYIKRLLPCYSKPRHLASLFYKELRHGTDCPALQDDHSDRCWQYRSGCAASSLRRSFDKSLADWEDHMLRAFAVPALVLITSLAAAQDSWPAKPVTVIVPFGAGGNTDSLARIYSARLSARLGQQFVIENRVGAGSIIGLTSLAKAAPDGYTTGVGTSAGLAINPAIMKEN